MTKFRNRTKISERTVLTDSKFPLEVFVAGRNRLEDPGAKALAKAIVHMKCLKEFAIAQNGIRKHGIKALSIGVAGCSSLQILNLNDNTFTSFGAIPMARALSNLPDLEVIEFGDCLIRNRGCEALTTVIEENKFRHLRRVNVYRVFFRVSDLMGNVGFKGGKCKLLCILVIK